MPLSRRRGRRAVRDQPAGFTNFFVQRQNMQQIQVLAFVLMQTFDLNIENRLWIDLNTGTNFHKLRQTDFIRLLDLAILLTEFRIISEFSRLIS